MLLEAGPVLFGKPAVEAVQFDGVIQGEQAVKDAPESAYCATGFGANFIVVDEENDPVVVVRWMPNLDDFLKLVLDALKDRSRARFFAGIRSFEAWIDPIVYGPLTASCEAADRPPGLFAGVICASRIDRVLTTLIQRGLIIIGAWRARCGERMPGRSFWPFC